VTVAGPHVSSLIARLALHTPQDACNAAFTPWSILGMHDFLVAAVCDVEPLVARDRMRRNHLRRGNAVFPVLLHISMHHKQRIVREMDSDLALKIAAVG
jgi:hypothetical protein